MPPLSGFSDNPFNSHSDFTRAALALVQPLDQYKSPQKARIKIATSTGAGFSETAAQLEGFSRPLWVVTHLVSSSDDPGHLETWIEGLKAGTDPKSPEYWGDVGSFDQRMVEMESIAYALLSAPSVFGFEDDAVARQNLISWLRQINAHDMPQSNWLWFRVLVNLALVRVLGVPMAEVKHHIDESLRVLDTFYLGDGWSSDGLWCDERKQADYYSGSFAIQFAQLLFVRFAPDYDSVRTARYKEQAKEFAKTYWRYFGPSGAAIPFGRSLTYRFAFAAFWSAVVVAGIELPTPLAQPGVIKGLLARHLRWWANQPHIFNTDGTPNIGFTYPNMYLAEDYNSPQSVYWCLKPFILLSIPPTHPFWIHPELPYPTVPYQQETALLWPPRHILCNTPEHHFLLSCGQATRKRFKAREAKYGKFAYSSAFGFSAPCGPFLEQIAPDSTLALRIADGEGEWKVHWEPEDVHAGSVVGGGEEKQTLTGRWQPWKQRGVVITTTLVPPLKKWPGWHIRIHRVCWQGGEELELVDAGFAASTQTLDGISIYEQPTTNSAGGAEGQYETADSAIIISESGASGVADLTSHFIQTAHPDSPDLKSNALIIRADPNTNIIAPRTSIPAIQHTLPPTSLNSTAHSQTFVTGIFAIHHSAHRTQGETWSLWTNRPRCSISDREDGEEIRFSES